MKEVEGKMRSKIKKIDKGVTWSDKRRGKKALREKCKTKKKK